MTQHANLPDSQLHEPKGVASASLNDVYVADGAGSGTWKQINSMGFYDYNDATTASTPIALTSASTYYTLTNDGAGAYTNKTYALSGVTEVFDVSTNGFDFTGLTTGDTVDIRVDVEVTTSSSNTAVDMKLVMADGSGASYDIPVSPLTNFKTAGTYKLVPYTSFYIGDNNTRDYPAYLKMSADATGVTVKVNGWYVRVIKRGE